MDNKIKTREEASNLLHALSERSIQNIAKAIDIHLMLDPQDNVLANGDDRFYRMRKVLLHALMIRDLGGHNSNLHAFAVEFRVAKEQIDIVLEQDSRDEDLGSTQLYDLSAYAHPSATLLVYQQSMGGLAADHSIYAHLQRLFMLTDFVLMYTDSLKLLADTYNKELTTRIQIILDNFVQICRDLPPIEEFDKFLHKKPEQTEPP